MLSLILILRSVDLKILKESFSREFPVKSLSVFLFTTGILVTLLWLKEILPSIQSNSMPDQFKGVNTLFAQAIDLGINVPAMIFFGIMLIRRNIYGIFIFLDPSNRILNPFSNPFIISSRNIRLIEHTHHSLN